MTGLSPLLAEVKTPTGWSRFFPPGEHPATFRLRKQKGRLETLRKQGGDTVEVLAALLDIERQLRQFEDGEWKAKLQYTELSRDRSRIAGRLRDWLHETSLSRCNGGSDTCDTWDLAYEVTDRILAP